MTETQKITKLVVGYEHNSYSKGSVIPVLQTTIKDTPSGDTSLNQDNSLKIFLDYAPPVSKQTFLGLQKTPEQGYRFEQAKLDVEGIEKSFGLSATCALHVDNQIVEVDGQKCRKLKVCELVDEFSDNTHMSVTTDGLFYQENNIAFVCDTLVLEEEADKMIQLCKSKPGDPIFVRQIKPVI